ncbi:sodium:solute symporter [Candidatus Uabimicrobium sp. HlEnr_7]|uniref:sodium:solute symporter family protein n=1 Tax=Candidatus Uabimicrobium helgolandensis TaxID=3095367 RepID=UPI003557DF0E
MTVLIVIICYLMLLVSLGVASARFGKQTSNDFFVAGRSIGPFLLFMSLFGTTMTAFALVGSSGEAYERGIGVYGLMASASGIVHSAVFFLIGMKLWVFGKKYGYTTQIQYFRDRFESDAIGLVLFPVLVLLVLPYLLIGLLASGASISALTQGALPSLFAGGAVPPWLGSLVICFVVLTYIFFGGIRGAAWANAFQTCVFIILGMVAFYMIADALGGAKNATQMVLAHKPDLLARSAHISKFEFATYMLIPLSVGMFPHLFQHWLTAKSAKSFRLSIIAHPLFIMLVWVPCVLIGVWASSAMINGGLIVPEHSRANQVLTILIRNLLDSPILTGLLGAGILAAIMSSLDSQFLCLGTIFTNDIVLHYADENKISNQQKIWIARGFIIAIVAATYFISLFKPRQVFPLAIWCFTGFSSLFPLVFASIYWKKTTKIGAFASILTAIFMWLFFFLKADWGAKSSFVLPEILPFISASTESMQITIMPVLPIIICSTLALIIGSLLSSPPSEKTVAKFFK